MKHQLQNNEDRDRQEAKDWFFDDPDWGTLAEDSKNSKNTKTSAYDNPVEESVEVKIKLAVPKKLVNFFRKITKKNLAIGVATFILITGVYVVLNATVLKPDKFNPEVAGSNTPTSNLLPREKPTFSILYPGDKTEETIGEIVRISPPGNDPAYSYVDEVAGIKLNVTQQQLPERFKTNTDSELEKLAKDFQQNELILVDSVKVFHGRSESGVQSLTFVKGNLLIFIRSSQTIEDDTWAAYISSLHT